MGNLPGGDLLGAGGHFTGEQHSFYPTVKADKRHYKQCIHVLKVF